MMSAKLRPNPFSSVTVRHSAGDAVELRVWSATKSRGAVTRNYSRHACADFDRLCRIAALADSADAAPAIHDYVALAALGLWAPETDLIDPILLEAPIRSEVTTPATLCAADDFAVRGQIWLQSGFDPCEPARHLPLGCLSAARPILWHRGSDIEPLLPWWPDAACLAAIDTIQSRAPLRPELLPALRVLADQGILVRAPSGAVPQAYPGIDLAAGRDFFAREGFVNLGQMLPPGQRAAFHDYWRRLAALELFPLRGDQRHGSHGEPSSVLLLNVLRPLIEYFVGSPVEPAFSYSWFYGRGTEMPRHRDRAESRYTVTFLIDYSPEIAGPSPWPLVIWPRGQESPVEIHQAIGDAVLFCGEDIRHARPPFTMGERSTSLLLHYVDKAFAGKLF